MLPVAFPELYQGAVLDGIDELVGEDLIDREVGRDIDTRGDNLVDYTLYPSLVEVANDAVGAIADQTEFDLRGGREGGEVCVVDPEVGELLDRINDHAVCPLWARRVIDH